MFRFLTKRIKIDGQNPAAYLHQQNSISRTFHASFTASLGLPFVPFKVLCWSFFFFLKPFTTFKHFAKHSDLINWATNRVYNKMDNFILRKFNSLNLHFSSYILDFIKIQGVFLLNCSLQNKSIQFAVVGLILKL